MKKLNKIIVIGLGVVLLTGCAAYPTKSESAQEQIINLQAKAHINNLNMLLTQVQAKIQQETQIKIYEALMPKQPAKVNIIDSDLEAVIDRRIRKRAEYERDLEQSHLSD